MHQPRYIRRRPVSFIALCVRYYFGSTARLDPKSSRTDVVVRGKLEGETRSSNACRT